VMVEGSPERGTRERRGDAVERVNETDEDEMDEGMEIAKLQ
jgi:hypothetical protein